MYDGSERGTNCEDSNMKVRSKPKPITISPELAARCDGNDQTERMGKAFRAVLNTPHSAVEANTKKRKRAREKKRSVT